MFGSNVIKGTSFNKLDSKCRILLPKFTYAETGDSVVLCHDEKNRFIDVFSSEYYESKLEKYTSIADKTLIADNAERVLKIRNKMLSDFQKKSSVDKRRRINIGSRLVEMFVEGETAVIVGMTNRVRIFATENDYNQYIKKLIREEDIK